MLAVVTAGAAFTTTAQAADPCVYTNIKYVTETWSTYEIGTKIDMKHNEPSEGIQLELIPDANKQDWWLAVDAYNIQSVIGEPDDEGKIDALGVNLIGTIGATVDAETDEVELNGANALALMISPKGDLRFAATSELQKPLRSNVILGNVGTDWRKENDPVSVRVIFAWDADGGQPKGTEPGRYGALTLVGAYLLSNEEGHGIIQEIDSHYTGTAFMTNHELPADLFGWDPDGVRPDASGSMPLYTVVGAGQVKTTLYTTGVSRAESDWMPNAGWVVTGNTSISGLYNGQYYDSINGEYRNVGFYEVTNPNNNSDVRTVDDVILFQGREGALVLDSEIDGRKEYQLTNNTAEITTYIDPEFHEHQVTAGFGATREDLTLRVDIDVLENTALSTTACGLNIVGEGTTILEIDNTGLERWGKNGNIDDGLAIELDAQETIEDYISLMHWQYEGLRIAEVEKKRNPISGKKYYFLIKDSSASREITFEKASATSNIILAPKGNGTIVLSLLASNLGAQSKITMVDEATNKYTETITEKVGVLTPMLKWWDDGKVSTGTPVFDDKGNPIFAAEDGSPIYTGGANKNIGTEEGQLQPVISYKLKIDKETGMPVKDEQGEWVYVKWKDLTDKDAEFNYSRTYDIKDFEGNVVYTMTFTDEDYVPNFVSEVKAVVGTTGVLKNGDNFVTQAVTKDSTFEVEHWDGSVNEHTAIEKIVPDEYKAKDPNSVIARPISGTGIDLKLYSSSIDSSVSYAGYITNDVSGGGISIKGRKAIFDENELGEAVQTGGILSTLNATGLKSSSGISVDSNVNLTEYMEAAGSIYILSGTTAVDNMLSVGGSIMVSDPEIINDKYDPHSASLLVRDTLTIGSDSQHLYVFGTADINKIDSPTTVYVGTRADKTAVTPDSALAVNETIAPEIRAPKVAIIAGGDMPQTLVSGRTVITPTGIESACIEANTDILLRSDESVLGATEMKGSDIFINDSETAMATNVRHSETTSSGSTGGHLDLNSAGAISTGTLTVDSFIMPENYLLAAAELNADLLVTTPASEVAASGLRNVAQGAEFANVHMKDAIISHTGTIASEITADSISLPDGHTLSDAVVTMNSKDGEIHAADNTVLVNLDLRKGVLITQNNVVIDSLKMAEGTKLMTMGSTSIYNMSLSDASAFGGNSGQTFIAAQAGNGADSNMVFNGYVDSTGNKLTVTEAYIDASGVDFTSADGSDITYELLKVNPDEAGASVTTDENAKIVYDVQPYTYVDVVIKDGVLSLVGKKDENGAWNELADTEIRKEIQAAIEEARVEGGVLDNLYQQMGQVKNVSKEQRQEILDALSGASIVALADTQRRGVQDMQNNLRNRIIQMGGSADWENSGIQAWAQADSSFSTTDGGDGLAGYDYNTWGATVGANIDLTPTFTAGLSFSTSYGEIKSDHVDHASGNNDAYYVSFFARHMTGRWTQMLILSMGQNDMDMERTVGGYTAEGTTEGSSFSAYYELGYTLGLNEEFSHILQPIVSFRITSAKVDGYEEEGSIGDAGITYDGASCTYGTVGIGLRYQGVVYRSVHERNGVLEVRAQVTSDFGDATDSAELALGGGSMREVKGTDTTGTGFDFGAGLSIPVGVQTTVFADADVNVRPDYTGVRANVGLRFDF